MIGAGRGLNGCLGWDGHHGTGTTGTTDFLSTTGSVDTPGDGRIFTQCAGGTVGITAVVRSSRTTSTRESGQHSLKAPRRWRSLSDISHKPRAIGVADQTTASASGVPLSVPPDSTAPRQHSTAETARAFLAHGSERGTRLACAPSPERARRGGESCLRRQAADPPAADRSQPWRHRRPAADAGDSLLLLRSRACGALSAPPERHSGLSASGTRLAARDAHPTATARDIPRPPGCQARAGLYMLFRDETRKPKRRADTTKTSEYRT